MLPALPSSTTGAKVVPIHPKYIVMSKVCLEYSLIGVTRGLAEVYRVLLPAVAVSQS